LSLEGPLSFGASRYLTQLLNDSDVYACLVLDLTAVSHLGVTASLAIDALCRDASQQGRRVLIAAPQPRFRDRLTRFGIARYGGVDFCASRTAALELAASSAARSADQPGPASARWASAIRRCTRSSSVSLLMRLLSRSPQQRLDELLC
ncbi:MAG: sodium-independent anion transporter, partial [Cyanobacteria bacterium M_surface_9_m1_291]|nr:sodium-independent anion transporter [Cyanobacteria bacterium M_surface_9_m1_291]